MQACEANDFVLVCSPGACIDKQGDTMKYILVTGGVISGVGKGVIASSIGTLLRSCGIRVTSIKIDPYINIDAGTFSPYEHGKLNVTLGLALKKLYYWCPGPVCLS